MEADLFCDGAVRGHLADPTLARRTSYARWLAQRWPIEPTVLGRHRRDPPDILLVEQHDSVPELPTCWDQEGTWRTVFEDE